MSRFTQEQLVSAYRKAPEPIQDAFGGEIVGKVISDIQVKYRLHSDTAGNLAQEVGYLMIGLITPAEFFGQLMLSGTDEQTARGIMQEINERIFMALRRQMTENGSPDSEMPKPVRAPIPERPPVVPAPTVEYSTPAIATPILPGSSESLPPRRVPEVLPVALAPEIAPVPSIERTLDARFTSQGPAISTIPSPKPSQPATQTTAKPLVNEYGADPYREPI